VAMVRTKLDVTKKGVERVLAGTVLPATGTRCWLSARAARSPGRCVRCFLAARDIGKIFVLVLVLVLVGR
jgi:hypothetical protein